MKNNQLMKTNILISVILIIGFTLTAIFSYQANYQASLDNIEYISALTAEDIYHQLTTIFAKPVAVSLTMSNDSLLAGHMEEEGQADKAFIEKTQSYLQKYHNAYNFDSVFLVSAATGNYYNFNGLDRVLKEGNPENDWYFNFLKQDEDYYINIDNDEVSGADNKITMFVDCKIKDGNGRVLGVVGVGVQIDSLTGLLNKYKENYNVEACLISEDGVIQISPEYTGYEKKNWFDIYNQEDIRGQVLGWKDSENSDEIWTSGDNSAIRTNYIVTRYIPELSWHLVAMQNTGNLIQEMKAQLYKTIFMIVTVIMIVLIIITVVIKNFNKQITNLLEERQQIFKRATEQLYDNIYELNITKNCCVGKRTEQYFESLGAKGLPYNEGLKVIAQKQIKEAFREGYIHTFTPENVIREYDKGNNHLRYDFMITQDGVSYHWMRIDAYIFFSAEDSSIHMFTYRKNIDAEKQKEIQASTDEMTMFFTKTATERIINRLILQNTGRLYAFFIFDIDNFKQANDKFGHAFGDYCIKIFTGMIRKHFRENDVLGRIGGDEFAAFIPVTDSKWVANKAEELSKALNITCKKDEAVWQMSASIGIAVTDSEAVDFETLYKKADQALYRTKENGKSGYTIYKS